MQWKKVTSSPVLIAIGVVIQLPGVLEDLETWADWLDQDSAIPVFMIGLILVTVHFTSVAWNHGHPYRAWYRELTGKTAKLREEVDDTYHKVNRVVNPGILNPDKPGNPVYMKDVAVESINLLRVDLMKIGEHPPARCDGTPESLAAWCDFLRRLRERLR